jgi:perosamine synthetase
MHFIPVYQPSLRGNERRYVDQCLDSTWISSKGEFIPRFEDTFAKAIGAIHATSVCNGTVALHLALKAAGIGAGDEVIAPTLTYIASINMIAQTGATPVLVDALAPTWQMDPDEIRRKLTPRTRAVMAVHLYGHPCAMDALAEICHAHGLLLIEDCAEAFGSYYRGRHVGTFGDLATFSFFGNKTITTGEGGMVVASSAALIERCIHLKTQGVSPVREYWHDEIGYNYRMTNICAAIGVAQLERADAILAQKRAISAQYNAQLRDLPLQPPPRAAHCDPSNWMYSVVAEQETDRDPLRAHLKLNGIETRPFFNPAHRMPAFFEEVSYPVAERLSSCGITLPSSPDLSAADLGWVCDAVRGYFNGTRKAPAGRKPHTDLA